jgi:hypothetical protein
VSRKTLDELKQQIPLLDYLEAHDWQPARRIRAASVSWDCARCTPITSPAFCLILTKTCFTATVAVAAVT